VQRFEEGLDKDAGCHRFFVNSHSKCLIKEAPEGFGDFNIGQAILAAKYAGGLVLLAKKETVLQGMIDGIVEFGRFYGVEMNDQENKVMRISRQPSSVQITID
jgi:hypothetical protein